MRADNAFVGWRDADWRVVSFAAGPLFVVRLPAVSIAQVGTDSPARSRLFTVWLGPRGIGTLVAQPQGTALDSALAR
ncbi:hypothetical protein [Mycobacterium sp. JS623]|uniref:hypothetical protein n=1 Tax=Mycobacterium sp. JS623 TaxID=212767 RepID=UPI000318207E|nr:hypothetical protein [Mycobacterium sp. JS623]